MLQKSGRKSKKSEFTKKAPALRLGLGCYVSTAGWKPALRIGRYLTNSTLSLWIEQEMRGGASARTSLSVF